MMKYSESQLVTAAELFSAVADPGRLRVIGLLLESERCAGDLARELGEELSTISNRLRLLRVHGLIKRRRQGKHQWYSLVDEHVNLLIQNAISHAAESGKRSRTKADA
jgi:ArsR family transcriptional regulator